MSGRELLEDIVKKGAEELRLRDKALDTVMARARRARILSKQAILKLHSGEESEAGKWLEEAFGLIVEMNGIIEKNPALGRFDQISAAKEEYSEASIIMSLMGSGEFPDPAELGVPITSYLLGLGDVDRRGSALDYGGDLPEPDDHGGGAPAEGFEEENGHHTGGHREDSERGDRRGGAKEARGVGGETHGEA
jgi:hypothetical protein